MFLINKIVSVAWQLSRIAKILTIIAFYDKYVQIYSCNIKENYLGNKYLGGFIMQRNNTNFNIISVHINYWYDCLRFNCGIKKSKYMPV